jgi:hypothetical protein
MLKLLLGSCAIFLITGLINSEIVHFEGCPGDLFFFFTNTKIYFSRERHSQEASLLFSFAILLF